LLALGMYEKCMLIFTGKMHHAEDIQQKIQFSALLVWLGIIFATILLTIDIFLGCVDTLWIHVVGAVCFLGAGLVSRSKYSIYSRFLLPLGGMAYTTLMAVQKMDPGSMWFFNVIALTIVTLFTYDEKSRAFILLIINLIAFLTTFHFLKELGPLRYLGPYNEFQYLLKFFICTSASVGIIFVHVRSEYHARAKLKDTTAELKDKQRKYELVLNASGSIVFEYDLLKDRVPRNAQINRMLGYEPDELGDMTIAEAAEFVHPDDRLSFFGKFEKAFKNGDSYTMEYRVKRKNNDYIWVTVSGVIERNALNQPSYLIGSTMPIDGRKQAELKIVEQNKKLVKANLELDNFVYRVSHDIRAPLSSILGLANLGKRTDDVTELKKYLGMVEERANALDKFIHDILNYSKNIHNEVERSKINLKRLVEQVLSELDYIYDKRTVMIYTMFSDDAEIMTDRQRIYLIMSGLLSNSLQYRNPAESSSWIRIKLETQSTFIITVEDNGIGIQPSLLPRIFDMFFRATESSKGSGIGLYIVREAVAKIGGTIDVESEPGKRTLFTLNIPKE
jgi:PAS domain S-box-containing protein